VHLAADIAALRGYQLHLEASGGKNGTLELVDISIREPSVFSQASAGASPQEVQAKQSCTTPNPSAGSPARSATASPAVYWSAFNHSTHQMVAGLDCPEGVPATAGAYLSTFTYRLPSDAAGTFTVDVLYDGSNRASSAPKERTFLFGRYGGLIDIDSAAPTRITVLGEPRRVQRAIAR
jgi:hypothetical protein